MAIDLNKLLEISQGDPDTKITVKRSWLTEVYRLISEGQRAKRELAELRAKIDRQFGDVEDQLNGAWDTATGSDQGGIWESLFGKKKK